MKNFRKVLALVLVVATLFSLTAMAGAKSLADYKDTDKVADIYAPAVDVLSGLGILEGYEDDTFGPQNKISREEMAAMIARLSNAGDDVSKLYATACTFADVAKDKWSASYVAYCAKTGIVAGRSATTFDPTGKVTGLETAKMLLVVIGFNAEHQGYVGGNWKINVLRDAKNAGLLNGFAADYDVDAAITREEAAHMMLNALQSNVVIGFLSNNILTVTNTAYRDWNGTLIDATNLNVKGTQVALYGNVLVAKDTLMMALYKDRLTMVRAMDCYGRPGYKWTLKDNRGTTILDGKFFAAPVEFKNHDGDVSAVLKAIDPMFKLADYGLTVYVDGQKAHSLTNYDVAADKTNLETLLKQHMGKGVQVEVYVAEEKTYDADGKLIVDAKGNAVLDKDITIVIVNTFLGEVFELDTVTNKVTIRSLAGDYTGPNTYGFKPADEGTIVKFWICDKDHADYADPDGQELHFVEVAEPKTIKLHGAWPELGKFCDGQKNYYEYAETFMGKFVFDNESELDAEYDLYLDQFGYVLGNDLHGTETKVSLLVNHTAEAKLVHVTNYDSVFTYTGKFVEFAKNPTVGDALAIDEAMFNQEDQGAANVLDNHDVLVSYSTDADGVRVWNKTAQHLNDIAEYKNIDAFIMNKASGVFNKYDGTKANHKGDQIPNMAADNNSQILVRVYSYITGKYEYKYFDGKANIDNTYVLTDAQIFWRDYDIHDAELRYVDYMYAEASYVAVEAMAFLTSFESTELYISEGKVRQTYYLYNAFVDGKPALVAFDTPAFGTDTEDKLDNNNRVWVAEYQLIIAESHDGLPVYLANAKDLKEASMGGNFKIHNGILEFDGNKKVEMKDIADDAKVIVFTQKDGKLTANAVAADDVVNYISAHKWVQQYGWYDGTPINVLYILVSDK